MTIATERDGHSAATGRDGRSMNQLVGQKIKAMRKHKHMKQGVLADKTGLTQAHLSYMEKGERPITVDTMASIADALGCQMVDLLPVSGGGRSLFSPQLPL